MSAAGGLPAALFERLDDTPDALFYQQPRFVNHIDDSTIAALAGYYGEILGAGDDVLDLMSSWVSHLPDAPALGRVAGLGMNAEELAANPRLGEWTVHDLNADPTLPYDDDAFDAVLCAVSVQYLVHGVAVFAEVARVLRPGGRVAIAMSHRCFPTKAVRAFHAAGAAERCLLVSEYLRRAGGYVDIETLDRSPTSGDPLWIVAARAGSNRLSKAEVQHGRTGSGNRHG